MITGQNQSLINIQSIPVNLSIKNTTLGNPNPDIPDDNSLVPATSKDHILILLKLDREDSVAVAWDSSVLSHKSLFNPLGLSVKKHHSWVCTGNSYCLSIATHLEGVDLVVSMVADLSLENALSSIEMPACDLAD